MVPAMKRILIAYYSLSGNTARVAKDLAVRLGADVLELRETTSRRGFLGHLRAIVDSVCERPAVLEDPGKLTADYDLTIVGTPIWAGRITPAARACLESIRNRGGDIAFFLTSGGTEAERVVPAIERLIGRRTVAFGGLLHRDLQDAALYGHKLDALVTAVKLRPPHRRDEAGITHAHA
jgi:hypothetical protein